MVSTPHRPVPAPYSELQYGGITIQWIARNRPLEPQIVVGRGEVGCQLLEKCLRFDDGRLRAYEGVAANDIVLIKSSQELPWVKEALYLGRDPLAPHLYVPTNLQPDLSMALFDKAIYRKSGVAPVAVLPYYSALIPLTGLLALNRGVITAWLEVRR